MKCRNFMHILISYYIIEICLSQKKIQNNQYNEGNGE